MTTPAAGSRHEIVIEDVEYQRQGGRALLARLYRPGGMGLHALHHRVAAEDLREARRGDLRSVDAQRRRHLARVGDQPEE